jgi:hypothetical protein
LSLETSVVVRTPTFGLTGGGGSAFSLLGLVTSVGFFSIVVLGVPLGKPFSGAFSIPFGCSGTSSFGLTIF